MKKTIYIPKNIKLYNQKKPYCMSVLCATIRPSFHRFQGAFVACRCPDPHCSFFLNVFLMFAASWWNNFLITHKKWAWGRYTRENQTWHMQQKLYKMEVSNIRPLRHDMTHKSTKCIQMHPRNSICFPWHSDFFTTCAPGFCNRNWICTGNPPLAWEVIPPFSSAPKMIRRMLIFWPKSFWNQPPPRNNWCWCRCWRCMDLKWIEALGVGATPLKSVFRAVVERFVAWLCCRSRRWARPLHFTTKFPATARYQV